MMWLVDSSFAPYLEVDVAAISFCALLHEKSRHQFLSCCLESVFLIESADGFDVKTKLG